MHPTIRLLREIARLNAEAVASTGDVNPGPGAALIERSLATAPDRHRLVVGLSEYVSAALDGAVPDLGNWQPIEPSELP